MGSVREHVALPTGSDERGLTVANRIMERQFCAALATLPVRAFAGYALSGTGTA